MDNFDPVTGAPLTPQAQQLAAERQAAQTKQTDAPNPAQLFLHEDPPKGNVPPVQSAAQPSCSAQPQAAPSPLGTKRDLSFVPFLLFFSILFADSLFWYGLNAGAAVSAIALFVLGAAFLAKSERRVSAYGIICALAFAGAAVSLVFSDDGESKLVTLLLLVVLAAVSLLELLPLRRYEAGAYGAIGDGFFVLFGMSFGRLKKGIYGLFHTEGQNGTTKKRGLGGVLLGVLCALPVLAIAVPLLVSSDAAFEGLMNRITALEWTSELFFAVLLGGCGFVLLFSLLFAAKSERRVPAQKREGRGLAAAPVCAFLGAISVFYVLYLISQLAYFFNAFGGILPQNYTVAEYARRGFFEMSAVCVLNLLIVGLALIVSKKQQGTAAGSVKALSLFLCVFSVILVATAISKMALYIQSFGMTRLRILTSVFMIFLTVVFLAVALRLFFKKLPYLKVAVVTASLLLLCVSFANVDRIVAAYNVGAYQNGALENIDMDTLCKLSDAAVPYLLELTDDKDTAVAAVAKGNLTDRLLETYDPGETPVSAQTQMTPYDLRAFNLVEYRARQLLDENKARFFTPTN